MYCFFFFLSGTFLSLSFINWNFFFLSKISSYTTSTIIYSRPDNRIVAQIDLTTTDMDLFIRLELYICSPDNTINPVSLSADSRWKIYRCTTTAGEYWAGQVDEVNAISYNGCVYEQFFFIFFFFAMCVCVYRLERFPPCLILYVHKISIV